MWEFLDQLDIAWIFGGVLVALFAGGLTSFVALFGWSLAKTAKNNKDSDAAHSLLRDHGARITRIENFINGRVVYGQEHYSQQDLLGRRDRRRCSVVPDGPDPDI